MTTGLMGRLQSNQIRVYPSAGRGMIKTIVELITINLEQRTLSHNHSCDHLNEGFCSPHSPTVCSYLVLRLFGGLVLDIKRKVPFYLGDFRDGLNLQCVASFLFLYCACMSPVITFGGLLGEATEGRIVRVAYKYLNTNIIHF